MMLLSAIVSVVVLLLARWIVGAPGTWHAAWALLCCVVPAMFTLLLTVACRSWPPATLSMLLLAGTGIRLLGTISLAALVWCVILSDKTASFWGWIVVGYGLTLSVEVRASLRLLRAIHSRPPGAGSTNP